MQKTKKRGTDYSLYDFLQDKLEINPQAVKALLPSLENDFTCYAQQLKQRLLNKDFYKKEIANQIILSTKETEESIEIALNSSCLEKVLDNSTKKEFNNLHDSLIKDKKQQDSQQGKEVSAVTQYSDETTLCDPTAKIDVIENDSKHLTEGHGLRRTDAIKKRTLEQQFANKPANKEDDEHKVIEQLAIKLRQLSKVTENPK
ncbi:MAG: hypothetical protein RLY40_627 [Pseudomonadota bacterium]|jgi:hypothetical protein